MKGAGQALSGHMEAFARLSRPLQNSLRPPNIAGDILTRSGEGFKGGRGGSIHSERAEGYRTTIVQAHFVIPPPEAHQVDVVG